MLDLGQELYIPQDERTLRRVQRKVDELDRSVRHWARSVIDVLPRGLSLIDEETYILSLYLAQQRRLNLELDAQVAEETLWSRVSRLLPFLSEGEDEGDMLRAVHRVVAARLESDIERACEFFCRDRNIPPVCDPSIDWRVAIRYMAQALYRVASQMDTKRSLSTSPHRFELALIARDLAIEVAAKRRDMFTIFSHGGEPAQT